MHRAAELDPGFALARAQAVAPDDPRVRLATGWVYYHGALDYARALLEFEAAGRAMPNNGEVPFAIGAVLRRLGRYEEALDRFARARELGIPEGPPFGAIDSEIALTDMALRRYPEADRLLEQRLRVAPDVARYWSWRALLQLSWKGDTAAARAALADAPPTVEAELVEIRVLIELWDRHFAQAVALAQPYLDPRQFRDLEWYAAYADLRLGRSQKGADFARRLIAAREEELAASPDSVFLHRALAETYALVGARELALRHARKAVTLMANDAYWGPWTLESLALVYTLLGDREQALALLPGLLDKAYDTPLDAPRLRREPWWDPLRSDPRFERLLACAQGG